MFSKVARNIYVIDTGGLGFDRTIACYLVVGDKVALVDTGYARGFDRIITSLREIGVSRIDYIIPTHAHLDHFGATGKLAQYFPNSRILAHKRAAKHIIDPSRVLESAKSIFGKLVERFGETLPVEEERVRIVDDGEELDINGDRLIMLYTPGHAHHQLSVLEDREGILITADAVFINFPDFPTLIPTTPPTSFNPDEAEKTIKRINELKPTLLLTPHFGPRESSETYLQHNIDKMRRWIEKVKILSEEGKTLGEIVDSIVSELCREVGVDTAPPYAIGSVNVSVMGILHYLGRLK